MFRHAHVLILIVLITRSLKSMTMLSWLFYNCPTLQLWLHVCRLGDLSPAVATAWYPETWRRPGLGTTHKLIYMHIPFISNHP
jgi:hypothetical protein